MIPVIKTVCYELRFRYPFRIAHGVRTSTACLFVSLSEGADCGYGEAALPPYLKENIQSVGAFIRQIKPKALQTDSAACLHQILGAVRPECRPAMAALDMAWHDLRARQHHQPLWQWLGLSNHHQAKGMFTIGLDSLKQWSQIKDNFPGFPVLKLKTAAGRDRELVQAIRKITDHPLVIDANESWKADSHTLDLLHWLSDNNVRMVEQPFPRQVTVPEHIFRKSPLPLIADESFQTLNDLESMTGQFHGINIKLMKCGGLYPAMEIISRAREKGLQIMIGCMSESTCGCSAAAQLLSLADWYDLDGPWLIDNDPFTGLSVENGSILLTDQPGTGIRPSTVLFAE
jgi:L-alanine-DL-glutamate epimerase-like enolase superfamily enzyme